MQNSYQLPPYEGFITIKDYLIVKAQPEIPEDLDDYIQEEIIDAGLATKPYRKYRGMYYVRTVSGTGIIMVRNTNWWQRNPVLNLKWFKWFLRRIGIIKEDV